MQGMETLFTNTAPSPDRDRGTPLLHCRWMRGSSQLRGARFRAGVVALFLYICICAVPVSVAIGAPKAKTEVEALESLLSKESRVIPSRLPIELHAEKGHWDQNKQKYVARGDVTLSVGNYRLQADTVSVSRLDDGNAEVEALGNVIVRRGSEVVEADKLSFNVGDFSAILVNGKIRLSEHNIYLEGKKLSKVDQSRYRVEKGSYTTCSGATPAWRIYGKDLDISLGGYARLWHGLFYVRDIPVFYLPWFIYPAKRQRQTGFLMPTVSSSTLKGFDIRFPFFVNVSPSFDLTVVPRICTKRAAQVSTEFRYFPFKDLRGRFYGEYTNDWNFSTDSGPKTHRFYVTWSHHQTLPGDLDLKTNGAWLSDRDYFEFWGGRLDRRKRLRYVESAAVINRQWNNFLFQAEGRHFDDLHVPDNAVTVQNLPVLTGSAFAQRLPYTPLYFSSTVDYSHFYAPLMHDRWLGSRLRMNARLSLPIALGRYLKMEPSMTFLPKAYWASYFVNDEPERSVHNVRTDLYQVNADVFTDLQADFDTGFLGFQRVRHSIRPRIAWTYRPPRVHEQTYPVFDDSDRVDRISLVTAELRQTLTGRLRQGEHLDFFTLSLSQGYDFYTTRTAEDPLGARFPPIYRLTNTHAKFSFKPHSLVDFMAEAEYDPVVNRARKYSINIGLMDHRGDFLRVVHQFTEDEKNEDLNRQTNVDVSVKLTSALQCFFQNQYTHLFNFSYFTSAGLVYSPQCWSLALKYSEAREKDPVTGKVKEPDQTVFLTLGIGQLGPIYSIARDWRQILGQSGGDQQANGR